MDYNLFSNPQTFLDSLKKLNNDERYNTIVNAINTFDSINFNKENNQILNNLQAIYDEFLEEYPFNTIYWNKYAQIFIKINRLDIVHQIYEKAVQLNPRNIDLWNSYCSWVYENYKNKHPNIISNLYERATKQIPFDKNANMIWEAYMQFETTNKNIENIDKIYWRLICYPDSKADAYVYGYADFITNLTRENYQKILKNHQDIVQMPKALDNEAYLINEYDLKRKAIKNEYAHMTDVSILDDLLDESENDEKESKEKRIIQINEFFRKEEQKANQNNELLAYFYEKSMVAMGRDPEFWRKYFNFLNQSSTLAQKIDDLFNRYQSFFIKIEYTSTKGNNRLTLIQWFCDRQEKAKNIEKARECYRKSLKKGGYTALLKYIYFEARQKNPSFISNAFEEHVVSSMNPDSLAFVITELTEIILRFDLVKLVHDHLIKLNEEIEYNKNVYISWVNLLKLSGIEWKNISEIFKKAYNKCRYYNDFDDLSTMELFMCRSYYANIDSILDLDKQYYTQRSKFNFEYEDNVWQTKKKQKRFDNGESIYGHENIEQAKKQTKS